MMLSIALNGILPACFNVCSHLSSQETKNYTSESLLSTLSDQLNCTLPAYLALYSKVHFQAGRYTQSHLNICFCACFFKLDPDPY
jgi:hypothetical protein